MTTREMVAVVVWAVAVVGAVTLAVVGTPLWFAVAGLGVVGLVLWARQRTRA